MLPMQVQTELNALKSQYENGLRALAMKASLDVKAAVSDSDIEQLVVPFIEGTEAAIVSFLNNAITKAGQNATVQDLEKIILGLINMPGIGGALPPVKVETPTEVKPESKPEPAPIPEVRPEEKATPAEPVKE